MLNFTIKARTSSGSPVNIFGLYQINAARISACDKRARARALSLRKRETETLFIMIKPTIVRRSGFSYLLCSTVACFLSELIFYSSEQVAYGSQEKVEIAFQIRYLYSHCRFFPRRILSSSFYFILCCDDALFYFIFFLQLALILLLKPITTVRISIFNAFLSFISCLLSFFNAESDFCGS